MYVITIASAAATATDHARIPSENLPEPLELMFQSGFEAEREAALEHV